MGKTKIEWADYSLNPGIYGCSKASAGCAHCYAAPTAHRLSMAGIYPEGITKDGAWTGTAMASTAIYEGRRGQ
jgi:protein gp37